MIEASLSSEPLDTAAVIARASDPACGAVAVFLGTVRETSAANTDARVVALEYEAAEDLARSTLEQICRRAAERFDLVRTVAVHRTGRCVLGEATVAIACSAPHRAQALDGCRSIIEAIKQEVPIFKKEIYPDGSTWVGVGS
jgi:molybdopterin synthase catalytic subunit